MVFKNKKVLILIVVFSIVITAVSGCANQNEELQELQEENEDLKQQVKEMEQRMEALEKQQKITLYFVKSTSKNFWLVPELREVKAQENMLEAALEELIAGPKTDGLTSLIPEDTEVLDVEVENWIAYADFSEEITKLNVGSSGEALVVSAIANTLTKFPGVEKVKILVEGEEIETLAGHVDLTEPMGRNDELILLETPQNEK